MCKVKRQIKKIDDVRLKAIAKRLALFRDKNKKTQAEVAVVAGISGVQYSRWESGNFDLSISKLLRLADYYGISIQEFFVSDILKEVKSLKN